MSRTLLTEDDVFNLAIAYFQNEHRDPQTGRAPSLGPHTFLGQQARALAQLLGEVLAAGNAIDDDAVPEVHYDSSGTLRTRNSTQRLDDWAYVLGLPSSTPGVFGRRGPTAARNGGAAAVGTPGVNIPTGTELTAGSITLRLRTGVTIPIAGNIQVVLDAVTVGTTGRLPVGTILRWSSPPPGLNATTVLTTALTGGDDQEDDVQLAQRIVARLQSRARGGSAFDFREWAESAEDSSGLLVGVKRAYVFPKRDGAGSVTVVPTFGGTGRARDPGAAAVAQIQAWLDKLKIATDTVYVVRPRFVNGEELTLALFIEPMPGYGFDWVDTFAVQGVTGTGTTLVINTSPPPPSLVNAIANGTRPRVALNYNSSPIPFVARATALALDTPAVGQATLTLDTDLPGTPAGIAVLPGSGATVPVSAAVANYIDNLGPSRSSGWADKDDPWEDNVTVAELAAATLGALDAEGQKVCRSSPKVGLGVGITVQIGAGTPSGDDYRTYDNVPGQGPQLAEVRKIVVREAA